MYTLSAPSLTRRLHPSQLVSLFVSLVVSLTGDSLSVSYLHSFVSLTFLVSPLPFVVSLSLALSLSPSLSKKRIQVHVWIRRSLV